MILYVTISATLVCAHEHSVTRQPAQMSHVWLHSRETVRGLCALLSVSVVLLGGHIRAERMQERSDDAIIRAKKKKKEKKKRLSCKRSLWRQQASEIPLPYSPIYHSLARECCSIQMKLFFLPCTY